MKRTNKVFIFSLALSLFPLAALAQDATPTPSPAPAAAVPSHWVNNPHDVSYDQAKQLFSAFGAQKGDTSARLKGLAYKACQSHFEFSNEIQGDKIYLRVRDQGFGSSCVADEKKKGKCTSNTCERLSLRDDASTGDISGDVEVVYGYMNAEDDSDKLIEKSFEPEIKFVSAETLRKQRLALELQAREAEEKALWHQADNCGGTARKNAVAMEAIRKLFRDGKLTIDEFELKKNRVAQEEFKVLKKEIASATADNLESLHDKLKAWGDQNAELDSKARDKVAMARVDLAKREVKLNKNHADSYERANDVLNELLETGGLSAGTETALKNHQGEIKTAQMNEKMTALARQYANNFPANADPRMVAQQLSGHPAFQQYLRELSKEAKETCQTTMDNRRNFSQVSFEGCSAKAQAISQGSNQILLNAATEVRQQQQINQQMAGLGNFGGVTNNTFGMGIQQPSYMGAGGVYGAASMPGVMF